MRRVLLLSMVLAASSVPAQQAQPLTVHAAGSLRAALGEVAREYEAALPGRRVDLVFGATAC